MGSETAETEGPMIADAILLLYHAMRRTRKNTAIGCLSSSFLIWARNVDCEEFEFSTVCTGFLHVYIPRDKWRDIPDTCFDCLFGARVPPLNVGAKLLMSLSAPGTST